MPARARRPLLHVLGRCVRRALLAAYLLHAGTLAAQEIVSAAYEDPTTRYAHGVLGDAIEHGTLVLTLRDGETLRFTLPKSSVFEDTLPRLVDLDGDAAAEVITVESSATEGARLAIYDANGRVAVTPYIGRPYRWLAPIGAADFDGDGLVEIAFIDRPHLAKTLRLFRFDAGNLVPADDLIGITNHRIGERDIAGGIRACDEAPEMVLATADWTTLVAVRYQGGRFSTRKIGNDTSREAFAAAMVCAN